MPNAPFSGNQYAFSISGASKVCVRKIVNAIPPTTPATLRLATSFFDMESLSKGSFFPSGNSSSKCACSNG